MILTANTPDKYKSLDRFRSMYWKRFEQKRNRYFSTVKKLTLKALNEQLQPALAAIEKGEGSPQNLEAITLQISFQPIANLFQTIYPMVGAEFAIDSFREVEKQKGLYSDLQTKDRADDRLSFFQRFLRSYALTQCGDKITGITDTTRNFVRSVMAQAAAEGMSIPQTVKKLREKWGQIGKHRATVIARSELVSISNLSAKEGAKATGLALNKNWLAAKDSHTRHSHVEANGQQVDINGKYAINGYKMDFPGDSSTAPMSETVQCRCTHYFTPK